MHSNTSFPIQIILIIACTISVSSCESEHCAVILGSNLKGNVLISQGYQETNLDIFSTGSFSVQEGCLLNICTNNWEDKCETITNETHVALKNVTSFSSFCICDTDLSKVYNVSSCARAYPRNNERPGFIDFDRNNKVFLNGTLELQAIFVQHGCSINLFEPPSLQGSIRTLTSGLQNFKGTFGSYECSCDASVEELSAPEPRKRKYKQNVSGGDGGSINWTIFFITLAVIVVVIIVIVYICAN